MMKAYNYYNARRLTIASTGARQASFSSFFECHVPRPVMQSVRRPHILFESMACSPEA
jgi:hypothetical protein